LTDHDLRKAASAPARHAAQSQAGNQDADRPYYNLYGLNCYLPNFRVQGHPDQKAAEDAIEEAFRDL
jgi:hypothetical protein